jgi:hypothetical protein
MVLHVDQSLDYNRSTGAAKIYFLTPVARVIQDQKRREERRKEKVLEMIYRLIT